MAREGGVRPARGTDDGARGDVHGFEPVDAGLGEGGEETLGHAGEARGGGGAEGKGFFGVPPGGGEARVPAFGLGGCWLVLSPDSSKGEAD